VRFVWWSSGGRDGIRWARLGKALGRLTIFAATRRRMPDGTRADMGVLHIFYRVQAAKFQEEVIPAFLRAASEGTMEPLLPYLDVERIRAETGRAPTVDMRTVGLFRKRRVARFAPSPSQLLEAMLPRLTDVDRRHDVDKLLYHLRRRTELLKADEWERFDEFLDWAHNLPELFQGQECPFGFLPHGEIRAFVEILRHLADGVEPADRAELGELCDYLSGTAASDGVLVETS
jgi:hypothetical protein